MKGADGAHLAGDVKAGDHVRVAEQAEWPPGHVKRAHRVEVVEDVDVFVKRRAVADLDEIVDDDGSLRQARPAIDGDLASARSRSTRWHDARGN